MQQIDVRGHLFNFHGTAPHIRQDGKPTTLYRWTKRCEHPGCAYVWDFKAPALNPEGVLVPPEHPSRHYFKQFSAHLCPNHRPVNTGERAKRRTLPTTYQSRSRGTKADIVEMHELAEKMEPQFKTRAALFQALALVFPFTPGTIREILFGRRRNVDR